MDGYTPQNAIVRFQSALTVANRNQRSKAADNRHDSDSSLTETQGELLNLPACNVIIEKLTIPPNVLLDHCHVDEEMSGSQLPLSSSTQAPYSIADPNKTTLVQLVHPPSPIEEDEELDADSESRFVID